LWWLTFSKNPNDTIKYWYAKEIAIADGPFETSNIQDLFDMKINTG
jgi:hypothetical protein